MPWGRSTRRTIWRLAAAGCVCLSGLTACSLTTDFGNLVGSYDGGHDEPPWWGDARADALSADGSGTLGGGHADGGEDTSPGDDTGETDGGDGEDSASDGTVDVTGKDATIDSSKPSDAGAKVDAADTAVVDSAQPDTSLPLGSQLAIHSGAKCMEAAGSRLVIYSCNVTRAQFFQVEDMGGGHLHFIESRSGKCVTNTGSSDFTSVQLATCNDSAEQTYQFEARGNGFQYIVNPNSGKCVEAASPGNADNTVIQIESCQAASYQEWKTQ